MRSAEEEASIVRMEPGFARRGSSLSWRQHATTPEEAPDADARRRVPRLAPPLPTAGIRQRPPRRERRRRGAARARHRWSRRDLRLRPHARARRAHDGAPGHVGQDHQPHAPHRRDLDRPPVQARGGAARLPRVGLRPALSRPRRVQRHLPGDEAHRCRPRHRLPPAFPRLHARGPGPGPDAGHRHDGRQGRPLQAPGRAGEPGRLRPHQGAPARRHRHPRHQGHRDRRALHARVPGHAVPDHDPRGRRFRRVLRRPGRCARRDDRGKARRAARRGGGEVLGKVRSVRRRRDLRRRLRAARARVPRRRARRGRLSDHILRHAPSPFLHRRAGRVRRPAHRRGP